MPDLALPKRRDGRDHQIGFQAILVDLGHVKANGRGALAAGAPAVEQGLLSAGRPQNHADLGIRDRRGGFGLADDHAQRGVGAGGQRLWGEDDGLQGADRRGLAAREPGDEKADRNQQGDGGFCHCRAPPRGREPE